MAQNMKVHMSSSDHYQVVPGDDPNEYSNVYIPSDSASCSSLDENEHNHDVEGEMTYPQDLLGVSWGSYLYSGPPTRGGHGPQNSFKRNVLQDGTTLNPTSISDQSTDVVPMDPLAATNVHGILRAPQAKDVTAQSKQTHQTKTVKIMHEEPPERVDSQLLFTKLQSLIKSLSDCELELEKCGLETVPVENSVFSGLKLKEFLKHIQDSKDDKSIISGRVMLDVIEYLQDIAERLMRQGKKLNEQALFLQRTGRQLGRNHQNLLEEQAMLELVTERTQGQLEKEKQELEVQKKHLKVAGEQLQTLLRDQRQFGRSNRMSSPHTIAQGRSQIVALKQTQKEQSRLEKIFLQQQHEIRNLQREQEIAKSDLLATKEHAERLQHKLEEQVTKMRKSTLLMTSYTYENREPRGSNKKDKLDMKKLLVNQRTLVHEVERMRRQLADQQRRERQLQHKQDSRQQQLKETGTKLKWQAAAVRGGYDYQEFRRPKLAGKRKQGSKVHASPYKLPSLETTKKKQQKRQTQREPDMSLPVVHLQPNRKELSCHHLAILTDKTKNMMRKKSTSGPRFTFSKTELESLACFRDEEVAQQVLEWLEMQGRLSDR